MMNSINHKVTADHLKRNAYLYVRQSTLRQVFKNTESTKRQYALRERAVGLGWPIERVIVIDSDLGRSGASSADREGFKKLVSEVGMGHAGIVLGLEVSRLARNSSDWHRLLEICALTRTLILDEEGIYDPCHFNDRLLLGLKGTMSEAELHMIKCRLQGGLLAKARRGELRTPLPIGFVYKEAGKVIFDPDLQIQESIRLVFETFRRVGSACATVKYFRKHGLKFPRKLRWGPNKSEVIWGELMFSRTLQILHNPRYAGAFFFGRMQSRKLPDGSIKYKKLPRDQWMVLLKDVHEGYITWEEHEENLRRLQENTQAFGFDRKKGPPREGSALIQGIVICGICGKRMAVRYHQGKFSRYMCQRKGIERGERICQSINGRVVDEAIGNLLIESVNPLALEVALNVQDELRARFEDADRLRKKQVERARYEADLARRRYMQVDPENRLVADSLEAEWNEKLRVLTEVQEEYERLRKNDRMVLNEQEKAKILALATDFPRLWRNPNTPCREKKRMVRLLLEDVTLIQDTGISVHLRFKGGAVKSLHLPTPLKSWQLYTTSKEVVAQIDQLLDQHPPIEIANILNKTGQVTGRGRSFLERHVEYICRTYGLKSRYERLRERGLLTLREISEKLRLSKATMKKWVKQKWIKGYKYNARAKLYELPWDELICRLRKEKKRGRNKVFVKLLSKRIEEVQYEV